MPFFPPQGGSGTNSSAAPKEGTALADASVTVNPGTDVASEYTLPVGTLTANRTLTIGTGGSPPGNVVVQVVRRDLSNKTFAVVNGGLAAGTLFTFTASPASAQAITVLFDGTNWQLISFFYTA